MTNKKPYLSVAVTAAMLVFTSFVSSALAQESPAEGSPYFTDPQRSYTEDLLLENFELVNDILCHYDQALVSQFDDGAPYNAWIAPDRCSGSEQEETSRAGDSGDPEYYDRGRLLVSSDAGVLKGASHWYLESENDVAWAELTATPADGDDLITAHLLIDQPSDDFEKNFSMRSDGTDIAFRYEGSTDGDPIEGKGYVVKNEIEDTGRGFIEITRAGESPESWEFGYTSDVFCRKSGGDERCFSRQEDNAHSDVWTYRLYELDGSRYQVDPDKLSGMSLRLEEDGTWGWIDYTGVWFPPATLRNLRDNEPVSADGETYQLGYLRYRLDEYLDGQDLRPEQINRSPFWIFGDGYDMEAYWDNDKQRIVVIGYDDQVELNFSDPSEFDEVFGGQTEFTLTEFSVEFGGDAIHHSDPNALNGWNYLSNSQMKINTDGNLANGEATTVTGAVLQAERRPLNSADVDLPDNTRLYCSEFCVTHDTIQDYVVTGDDPFKAIDQEYTLSSDPFFALKDDSGNVIQWPAGGTEVPAEDDEAEYGGRMDLYSQDPQPETNLEYTHALELGPGWDSYVLSQNDEILEFVRPEAVLYQVPEADDSSRFSGGSLILDTQGSSLNIPGTCFDEVTNEAVTCPEDDGNDDRIGWRDEFLIPFDENEGRVELLDGDNSRPLLVKWIERGLMLRNAASETAASAGVTYGDPGDMASALDGLSLCDPSDSTRECYIGPFPSDGDMNEPPRVIHGERQ